MSKNNLLARINNQQCVGCGLDADAKDCCKILGITFCTECLAAEGVSVEWKQQAAVKTVEKLYYC